MSRFKKIVLAAVAVAFVAGMWSTPAVYAHCQIPCGIYGDRMRVATLYEHITTIKKSMSQIEELSADAQNNTNQIVRWVTNKDAHADDMAEIVTQYFLQQRIKPAEAESDPEAYATKLAACHNILVSAMKCKQTTDVENVEALHKHVTAFAKAYLSEEDFKHVTEKHAG
jgi:hypothetical protein